MTLGAQKVKPPQFISRGRVTAKVGDTSYAIAKMADNVVTPVLT